MVIRLQHRNKSKNQVYGIFGTYIVLALAIRTWAFMVLLGMLAGYTGMHGLAIGFWASLGINALVGLGLFSGRVERK